MNPGDLLKMNYPPTILIYGMYGTGKTALVSQLSGAFMFDFNRGMRTAATLKDKFFDARQKITFEIYKDEVPTKPRMYLEAKSKLISIVNEQAAGTWKHDAVIIDDLTSLCQAAQLYVQYTRHGDALATMEMAEQDWLALEYEVTRFLILFQSIGVLRVITAHTMTIDKPVKGKILDREVVSIFPYSVTKNHGLIKLPANVDEIWYADYRQAGGGKINYRVTGKPTDVIRARTRSSFDMVIHNDIGMVGLLKMIGFDYPPQPKTKG